MKPTYSLFSRMGAFITNYILTPPIVVGAGVVAIVGIVGIDLCLISLR